MGSYPTSRIALSVCMYVTKNTLHDQRRLHDQQQLYDQQQLHDQHLGGQGHRGHTEH